MDIKTQINNTYSDVTRLDLALVSVLGKKRSQELFNLAESNDLSLTEQFMDAMLVSGRFKRTNAYNLTDLIHIELRRLGVEAVYIQDQIDPVYLEFEKTQENQCNINLLNILIDVYLHREGVKK